MSLRPWRNMRLAVCFPAGATTTGSGMSREREDLELFPPMHCKAHTRLSALSHLWKLVRLSTYKFHEVQWFLFFEEVLNFSFLLKLDWMFKYRIYLAIKSRITCHVPSLTMNYDGMLLLLWLDILIGLSVKQNKTFLFSLLSCLPWNSIWSFLWLLD